MIKLQDFAREQGVTDRQIQRLLKKYAADLEGLFERQGQNGTWLTDDACEFLRSKMIKPPAPIIFDADPRIAELTEKLDEKERLLAAAQATAGAAQERVAALLEKIEKVEALEATAASLRAEKDNLEAKVQEAANDAQKARDELTEARRVMQKDLDDAIAAFNQRTKELEDEAYLKQQEIEQLRNTKLLKRIFGWKKEK